MRFVYIVMFLLSLLAMPAGTAQKALTPERPAALSPIAVTDAVLSQQRYLIQAIAPDADTDAVTPVLPGQSRMMDVAGQIRPQEPQVVGALGYMLLLRAQGPPVA